MHDVSSSYFVGLPSVCVPLFSEWVTCMPFRAWQPDITTVGLQGRGTKCSDFNQLRVLVYYWTPRWGVAGAFIILPPPPPVVGVQGCQRFPIPLSKPVVGQNIALHAVHAYKVSTYLHIYLVSALPDSFNFIIFQKFFRSQQWTVY